LLKIKNVMSMNDGPKEKKEKQAKERYFYIPVPNPNPPNAGEYILEAIP